MYRSQKCRSQFCNQVAYVNWKSVGRRLQMNYSTTWRGCMPNHDLTDQGKIYSKCTKIASQIHMKLASPKYVFDELRHLGFTQKD